MYPALNQLNGQSYMANLATLLNHQALRKPDHTAIIEGERRVDYRTLADRVCKWASYLSLKFGLGVGDVIAVGLRDTADHVIINWAVVRLGGIILPIDHRWTDKEKRDVIEGFGARAYVTESGEAFANPVALDSEFRDQADAYPVAENFPEDDHLPMVLSLSSGTTGSPKGPAVTHRQMRATRASAVCWFSARAHLARDQLVQFRLVRGRQREAKAGQFQLL